MKRPRILTAPTVIFPSILMIALAVVESSAFALSTGHVLNSPNKPSPPVIERLLPLSEVDKENSHQTGCTFIFGAADNDYIQLIGDELLFRTPVGLHSCRIANADAFINEKGTAVCDKIGLKLHTTGRTTQYQAADSSSAPARLLVGQDRAARAIRGYWAVAC
jgi:hypothetical protein